MKCALQNVAVLLMLVACVRSVKVTVPELGDILGSETKSEWKRRTIYQFLSIPYALPPTGARRFVPPIPLTSFKGNLYNATVQRQTCPQLANPDTLKFSGSDDELEDCLWLNVFTPSIPFRTERKLLPVIVLFPGGGLYESGANRYPPHYILEKDVVLVVLQYRLGPLGFLSMQTDKIPGNAGFFDQIEGLKWVKKYIASFGGDSTQVTLMGQSAGAASASLLLFSPLVDDSLFHQVIMQSGSSLVGSIVCSNTDSYIMAMYSGITNISIEADIDRIESTLRNATIKELTSAVLKMLAKDPPMIYHLGCAVIQKAGVLKLIPDTPQNLLGTGQFRTLPMIAGATKHDGSFVLPIIYDVLSEYGMANNAEYLRTKLTNYILGLTGISDPGGALTDIFENKYFKKIFDGKDELTFSDIAPGLTDMIATIAIKAPTLKHAKANAYHNATYFYTFDYRGQYTRFGYETDVSKYPFKGGVHHSDDMMYLFKYPFSTNLNKNDTAVAKIMVDLWTSFAINGIPHSPGADDWLPIEKGRNGPYYHLNAVPYVDSDFVENEYVVGMEEKSPNSTWTLASSSSPILSSRSPGLHPALASIYVVFSTSIFLLVH